MAVTKKIVAYTSYEDNSYEAKVYSDKSIIIVCPPLKTEFSLQDLPEHRKEAIKPLIEFIEKDLNHSFNLIEE